MAGKRHQSKPPRRPALPRQLTDAIEKAGQLTERRRFDDALTILHEADRQFPNNFLVLQLLAEAAYETRDDRLFLDASDRMALAAPDEPEVMAQRAYAHLRMGFAFLAQRYFQQVIQRYPDHEISQKARDTLTGLQPAIAATTAQMEQAGYATADVPELSARHEQIQVWLARGKYADVRRVAAQLLSRWPAFAPALNNVAESWAREGNLAQAAAATKQTLAVNPDNTHALASLVRLLVLDGKIAEAREIAERLKTLPALHPDNRVKMAEALSLLGDNDGVLAVWSAAEQEGFRLQEIHLAYLHHLAAVAAYNAGDEKRARELWARCLRAVPNFTHANQCIEDLDQPLGEQNGPWPCPLDVLLSPAALGELRHRVGPANAVIQDAKIRDDVRRFLQQHPQVQTLLPLLLERGDPLGRELAVRIAGAARTPETLALLSDFSQSQRGPDRLRVTAAQALVGTDLSPGLEVRLWLKGEWRPFRLFDAEVCREPTGPKLPPRIEKILIQASELLSAGQAVQAEPLLRQALTQAPDSASIAYNLVTAISAQGRQSEAADLFRDLCARHPTYLFGVLQQARERALEGDADEAARLLETVKGRPRLHVTEFDALAITHVQLALSRNQAQTAQDWLRLLEAIDPDDPNVPKLRARVAAAR